MYLEISLAFLSAAVFLIAVVTVPLLFQIQKIARGLVITQDILQKSLPGLLQNLEEAIANINKTAVTVNHQIEGISLAVERIHGVFRVIMELQNVLRFGLRLPVFNFLRTAGAVARGIRVFLSVYSSDRR
jgi:hypothetical protein